jgi:hypothetical protein
MANGEAISLLAAIAIDAASDFFKNTRLSITFVLRFYLGAKVRRKSVNQKLMTKQNMSETKQL